MYCKCFSTLICLFAEISFAVSGNSPCGAKATGLAGCSVTSVDLFACFNNPAGGAGVRRFHTGTFFESRFLIPGVETKGLAILLPAGKTGVVGGMFREFGNEHLHDRSMGLLFSRSFGNAVSAGLRIQWNSIGFSGEYGNATAVTAAAGLIIRITEKAGLGVCLSNPFNTRYTGSQEQVPTGFVCGFSYDVSTHARCMAELEKSPGLPYLVRGSVEYRPKTHFALRAGASNSYLPFSFGTGFQTGNLEIDLSAGWHPDLGFSPGVSLVWRKK